MNRLAFGCTGTGRGPDEMDFDFTLEYTDQDCPGDIHIRTILKTMPASPIGSQTDNRRILYKSIGNNMVYPAKGKTREGIEEGRPYL